MRDRSIPYALWWRTTEMLHKASTLCSQKSQMSRPGKYHQTWRGSLLKNREQGSEWELLTGKNNPLWQSNLESVKGPLKNLESLRGKKSMFEFSLPNLVGRNLPLQLTALTVLQANFHYFRDCRRFQTESILVSMKQL